MKTSTAEANGHVCPLCDDEVTRDRARRGFVRHKKVRRCPLQRGQKDDR